LKPVVSTPIEARALISPRLKAAMIRVALVLRRLAEDGGAAHPAAAELLGDMGGVAHARAESEPGPARLAMGDHLGHGRARDGVLVDRVLEVARDELATPRSHAGHVEAGLRLLRDERGEITLIDQVADRHLVGDVGEERVLALVQHAAVEPEGRRRQPDHLQRGVDRLQVGEEAAIHGVRPPGDQMGLVDQHQIGMADTRRLVVDRLDAGEEDPGPRIAAAETGRVDARRRLRPEPQHLGMVLRDQLADMGDDQHALVGPGLEHAVDEGGHDEALAAGRGDHDERVAALLLEIAVDRGDRGLLVGAQGQHAAASSSRASLVQAEPSRMR
jgi:hypothetical protein